MTSVKQEVEQQVRAAAISVLGATGDTDPLVRPAKGSKFGDYQANLAMPVAKRLGKNPREIGDQIAKRLMLDNSANAAPVFTKIELAGPGFINLTLSDAYLSQRMAALISDSRLGVAVPADRETVVVDYSSPNLAKEMHIGHLRSSIIGDSICRVLAFLGHSVVRQNHLGDWGTQFGMLLEHLIDSGWDKDAAHSIGDLNQLYQTAKQRFDAEPEFKQRARQRVVALQAGDEQALILWRQLIAESVRHMNKVYQKLGLLLQDEDIRPESFYNERLVAVVQDLQASSIIEENDGAQVAFPPGFKNKEGEPLPLIVQKRDGGFGYAATDLAAGRFRVGELGASRCVYVTDARQSDHFAMFFSVLRSAGWAPQEEVRLEHVTFGSILGKDKKPFKTREGGTVRLELVLDEAIDRARSVVLKKRRGTAGSDAEDDDAADPELDKIASAVGVGAVKYADLSSERIKDYVFDLDRMLAMDGNTAPYLQNAYVRVQGIFRKLDSADDGWRSAPILLAKPTERALGLLLLQLPQVAEGVADSLEPHRLCNYLYDLASGFHSFYEQCKVLKADTVQERNSRLALSELVARALRLGLGLLGIDTLEVM